MLHVGNFRSERQSVLKLVAATILVVVEIEIDKLLRREPVRRPARR